MKIMFRAFQCLLGVIYAFSSAATFAATSEPECKVPHFTAISEVDGKVFKIDTNASKDDCTLRAKKLAYYGKWRADLTAEENALYANKWIANGEAEAREMSDYIVKTNALLGSVDLIAGWAKGAEKLIFADERTARLIAVEAAKIVAKTIDYGKALLGFAGKEAEADIAALTADTLRLIANTSSCIDKRDVVGCGKVVKDALKTQKSYSKVFGAKIFEKDFEAKLTGWVEFVLDAAQTAQSVGRLSVASSASAGYMAAGSLIDVTAKASTGDYWKDKNSDPKYWDEYIMAVATSTANWSKCKGAAVSLVDEQKKFIGNTADCVSSTVKTAVENMSRLMARSTVLYSASQDVYNAKKLQVARMLFDERFKYQSFNDVFRRYGVSLTASDRNPQLIEKYSASIGYDYRWALGRVLQVWGWQRYGDEVTNVMNRYAQSMINDAKALEAGSLNPQSYAKNSLVRFSPEIGGVKSVALINAGGGIVWNGSATLKIDANVTGAANSSYARLFNLSGKQLTNTSLAQAGMTSSGATGWWKNVEGEADWKALPDSTYSLSVVAIGADKLEVSSGMTTLTIKRPVASPPVPTPPPNPLKGTLTSADNQSTQVNSAITIAGTALGKEPVAVKVIYTEPSSGRLVPYVAARNAQAGTWEHRNSFVVDGAYPYRVEISDASGAAPVVIGQGRVTVAATATPPVPQPIITPVKPPLPGQSSLAYALPSAGLTVDQVATFNLTGANLVATHPPRISLDQCDNGALQVVSATAARYTCTPRTAGDMRLFWKQPADTNDNREIDLGRYTVAGKTPVPTVGMVFVSETVPDNTVIAASTPFAKSWTLRNTGSTTWDNSYCLRPSSGDTLGATAVCVSGNVAPNATHMFTTNMVAPTFKANDSTYKQNWALSRAGGNAIGAQVWAQIKVNGQAKPVQPVQPPAVPTPPAPLPPVSQAPIVQAPTSPSAASVQNITPLTGSVGQKVRFTVTGSQLAPTLRLQLAGESCTTSLAGDTTRREFECTITSAASPKTLAVSTIQGITLATQNFVVPSSSGAGNSPGNVGNSGNTGDNRAQPTPNPLPTLTPTLTTSNNILSGIAWSARLATNVPVHSADLVFKTGRRIPFDGGATQWFTNDSNARFGDAGTFAYDLQIRRTASAQLEIFPGGQLEVRAAPIPVITPRITSAQAVEQGKPYNLTVQTSASADRVAVQWPDSSSEQGLRAMDAQRTQWEFGNKLFNQLGAVNYTVRTYKDGVTAPTGQVSGVLNITPQAASMRLLEISKNIIVGESPYFTVEASLAVARITVQIGGNAAVELVGTGPGSTSQVFRAKVLASQVGTAVPYAITGYNAQGQALGTRITGTLVVAGVSDSLNVPSPVPVAGVGQGEYVSWRFGTYKSPDQMWMEFSAPIGNVQLEGAFFKHTFNYPVGTYKYKLMRKDYLGNLFAIQGASGDLVIKPKVDAGPAIKQVTINGQKVANGSTVQAKISSALEAIVDAPSGKSIVFKLYVQPFGEVPFRMQSNASGTWRSDMGGNKTLGDYLRGQAKPGNVAAKIYIDTGGTNVNTNVGGTVDFTVQLVP